MKQNNIICLIILWITVASTHAEIDIMEPLEYSIYQRTSNNIAHVSLSGTFGGNIDRVEGRITPRSGFKGSPLDWTKLPEFNGGLYSNIVILSGGWYDVEVRGFIDEVAVLTSRVDRVGIGDIFITCGQSNSANHGHPTQAPSDERVSLLDLNTRKWRIAKDPQPGASGTGGSPWPDFGDSLTRRTDTPVAVIAVGQGSKMVSQWLPGSPLYSRIIHAHNALKSTGGFRAILWHQGESDSLAGTDATTYATHLTTIIEQSRTDIGFMIPWGVALASYHPDSHITNEVQVLEGQKSVILNSPSVFLGAETDSFHTNNWLSDLVHFNDLGLHDHGRQWAESVYKALLSADTPSMSDF